MRTMSRWFNTYWQLWLDKCIPPNALVRLSHRQVFILPTAYGWVSLGVLLALFIGGINYANSLVLATTFWLAAIFLVSIFHTYRNLLGLTLQGSHVQNACVGDEAYFTVALSAASKSREHHALNFICGETRQSLSLVSDTGATVCLAVPVSRRGLFRPGRIKVASSFPLGLFCAWSRVDLTLSCWVYPRPLLSPVPVAACFTESAASLAEHKSSGVDDFEGLVAYQPGDPLKHLHWKAFARTDVLLTKTFITNHAPQRLLDWADLPDEHPEIKLSYLCYWVLKFSEQHIYFALYLPKQHIELDSGDYHCQRCLLALAQL